MSAFTKNCSLLLFYGLSLESHIADLRSHTCAPYFGWSMAYMNI